jgi:hypothetical protein
MKKVLCLLTLSLFVIPILTVSKASANEGHRSDFREANRSGGRDYDRHQEDRGRAGNSGGGGENAPIDGGITLLLAAGIGLGVKKAVARNKASKQAITDSLE